MEQLLKQQKLGCFAITLTNKSNKSNKVITLVTGRSPNRRESNLGFNVNPVKISPKEPLKKKKRICVIVYKLKSFVLKGCFVLFIYRKSGHTGSNATKINSCTPKHCQHGLYSQNYINKGVINKEVLTSRSVSGVLRWPGDALPSDLQIFRSCSSIVVLCCGRATAFLAT